MRLDSCSGLLTEALRGAWPPTVVPPETVWFRVGSWDRKRSTRWLWSLRFSPCLSKEIQWAINASHQSLFSAEHRVCDCINLTKPCQ